MEAGKQPGDPVGAATLELLREHDAYSRLIWERMRSLGSLQGRVLELGCGTGNLTRLLLQEPAVTLVHAVDIDRGYVERLRKEIQDQRFQVFESPAEAFTPPGPIYDRVVSINVLEHIEDDAAALQTVERSLAPGGECWLLVPAHPRLYSDLDKNLSHCRRYTRPALVEAARRAGLAPERLFHFNPVGALGWWLSGKILRHQALQSGWVGFYDRFGIVLSRWADRLNPFPFGLSLIARLRKPDRSK